MKLVKYKLKLGNFKLYKINSQLSQILINSKNKYKY